MMVELAFINLCDSSNEDGPSLPNVVVPLNVNSQLVEEQPLHLLLWRPITSYADLRLKQGLKQYCIPC
jgi:hypothetical protein